MNPVVGLPEPEVHGEGSAPERVTRGRQPLWDRVKFLLLAAVLLGFSFWIELADNPLMSAHDAWIRTVDRRGWLLALGALELVRQLHFLVAERSARYHRLWSHHVFGRFDRVAGRFDPWNRYRVARTAKLLFALAVLSFVLGALFDVPPLIALFELPAKVFGFLPFAFQIVFGFLYVILQFVGLFWFMSRGGTEVYFPDDVKTRFTDVWGQDNVLERVKENIVFLEKPELIEERGGYVPSGILLWGPPGTGKTLMAEAVAGETGKPFVFVEPGAFNAMFMGVGIMKVKALFRKLRKLALRYGGVIVFFDEADSLGSRGALASGQPGGWAGAHDADPDGHEHLRWLSEPSQRAVLTGGGQQDAFVMGGMGGGGGMGTLQALLTELSGLKKPRGFVNRVVRRTLGMKPKPPPKYRILVMMASNLPEALDEALLRPGRIDRMYKVGYPSKDGRKRTYQGYFEKVRHELTDEQLEKLSVITPYATGASIKDLVNEALITAIREGREVITWADVIQAKHLKSLGPGEDVEYVDRERHAIAIHEACHAIAAYRLRKHMEIDIATIEKGGTYLGMVSSIPPDDQFTRWRREYEIDIKVSLASLVGERAFFGGDNSSGVSGDLRSATRIASLMEGHWGMGETISSYAVAKDLAGGGGGGGGKPDDGEEVATGWNRTLGKRIEDNLRRLYEETEQLITENRREVLALAHALEVYKTLSGEDVAAVVDGGVGPLVDGRIYRTEEFLAEAERYHALAAASHAAHASVPMLLPDWRVREPVPVPISAAVEARPAWPSPPPPPIGGVAYPAAPPVAPPRSDGEAPPASR